MKSCLLALALIACSTPSSGPKPPTAGAAHTQKFSIGALEAYALADGQIEAPNDAQILGVGRAPSEIGDLLAGAGLPRDRVRLDIQALLVKTADRVLLFDTGAGAVSFPIMKAGELATSLARVGIAPAGITDIFISHAHGDHIGGLITTAGTLAFPAATVHLSAPEWAAMQADQDPENVRIVVAITPKVAAFAPGAQLLPEVKAVATPGHTPGHSSYEIGTGADRMFYLGDVAHHSVISVQRPAWSIEFDQDRPAAEAIRQQTLAALAAQHVRVFAPHFPFPGVGQVTGSGEKLAWQPATF